MNEPVDTRPHRYFDEPVYMALLDIEGFRYYRIVSVQGDPDKPTEMPRFHLAESFVREKPTDGPIYTLS